MTIYQDIYYEVFESMYEEDNELLLDVSMEGAVIDKLSDKLADLLEKIYEVFRKLLLWIDETASYVVTRFLNSFTSNKEFIKQYEEHKKKYIRTKENISEFSFEYNIYELKDLTNKTLGISKTLSSTYLNSDGNTPLDYDSKEFDTWVCKNFGSEKTDLRELLNEFRTKYKGQKKYRIIYANEIPKYEKVIYGLDALKKSMNSDIDESKRYVKAIRDHFSKKVSLFNPDKVTGAEKIKIMKRLSNISKFVKFRLSLTYQISSLLLEYSIFSMAILKKFYSMHII